jgi:hypothetical protein
LILSQSYTQSHKKTSLPDGSGPKLVSVLF